MASATSTYDDRLRLVDSVEEYKYCFGKAHFLFLVQESLELNRGGAEKLKYILGLASRCKTGVVSIELLARQIEKEYSLPPLLQEQEGGVWEGRGQEREGMETDNNKVDGQEDQQQDDEEEEEVPHVDDEAKRLFERYSRSFFYGGRWKTGCKPFFVPREDCASDALSIEKLVTSTPENLASAKPRAMPAYTDGASSRHKVCKSYFSNHKKSYHLCKKVAVSFDRKVYRAPDAEIEAALRRHPGAPSCSAVTYVKAAQEARRQHALARASPSGSD